MFYQNTETTGHEHQPKRDGRWLLAFQAFKFLTLAIHENFLRSKFKCVKTRSIKGFGILSKMRHNKSEIQILKILYDFLFGSHHQDGHILGDNGIMTTKIFFSVLLKLNLFAHYICNFVQRQFLHLGFYLRYCRILLGCPSKITIFLAAFVIFFQIFQYLTLAGVQSSLLDSGTTFNHL